jgi:cell wall-associated NlpC family hydrolase
MMITKSDIVDTARQYIGTPFHHQARVKGVGIDCAGLLVCVARDLGLPHYDVQGYSRIPSGGDFKMHLDANLDRIAEIEVGCILLMTFEVDPQHVAICSTQDSIIHAYFNARKCVEHILDDVWRNRINSIYRFRGVA